MLDKFFFTCNAVFPIIVLIWLGYIIKIKGILSQDFFKSLNKLCFNILLPFLLFYNIYNVSDIYNILQNWKVTLFSTILILVIYFLGFCVVHFFVENSKQKGVVLQCIFRSNFAIIGIPLATTLSQGNPEPVAIAAVISTISIPLFNILATITLNIFLRENSDGNETNIKLKEVLIKIIKNPLIRGVFIGILLLVIREFIPTNLTGKRIFSIKSELPFLYTAIEMVAKSATPLALIALGGEFTFEAISKLKKLICLGTVFRIVIVPGICLSLAYVFGFSKLYFPALIGLFGTPVAVSSVPMAAQMNNDSELAGQLVVWTTLFSSVTMFSEIFILAQLNLL